MDPAPPGEIVIPVCMYNVQCFSYIPGQCTPTWKQSVMTEGFLGRPPVRSWCSALSSQEKNSTGSDCKESEMNTGIVALSCCCIDMKTRLQQHHNPVHPA